MPERIAPGPVSGLRDNCEAVCIHTKKGWIILPSLSAWRTWCGRSTCVWRRGSIRLRTRAGATVRSVRAACLTPCGWKRSGG